MSKPLGIMLSLLAAVRRPAEGGAPLALPSPGGAGPLVWLHAQDARAFRVLAGLAWRLDEQRRTPLRLLLTHPRDIVPGPGALPPEVAVWPALPDDPVQLREVLAQMQPAALVLGGGGLPPVLINEADTAGVPVVLVNAGASQLDGLRLMPWMGLQRTLLRVVRHALLRDEAALRAFRRAGARPVTLEVTGPLAEGCRVLHCNPAEREVLVRQLGVRPVWLAVGVPQAEEVAILRAHRAAQRIAHRLLLILVPVDPARGPALTVAAREAGLRAARRGADEEPADEDQVYIADTEGELGLWYRLAPLCYVGGTLGLTSNAGAAQAVAGRDPCEAAALGSAVLHGPATGAHALAFGRLGRAGGARRVSGPDALAEAVTELLAPDRAAQLASAAWEVVTTGTEATDRAAEVIFELIDSSGGET
ncbi:3-deoxy-D-manno-octulosonic acid transferase [Alkalilacustris brevis]|uniref:3-deoxy-D-manno-octulosonic acid transferase n=1 Tax=Alkalilacustris brevis TaxID=2026338 RepID=UPI000E0D9F97|nr:glycosyltransferase N-terminal domain-containing protein [Alkalilacustris brevis]